MRFGGTIYQSSRGWAAEIPLLEAVTQGQTRQEALDTMADFLETLVDRPGFTVQIAPGQDGYFEASSADARGMVSLLSRPEPELNA